MDIEDKHQSDQQHLLFSFVEMCKTAERIAKRWFPSICLEKNNDNGAKAKNYVSFLFKLWHDGGMYFDSM